jgi:integrase
MASIRKKNNRWQVQVRSRTYGSISKTFHKKADAEKWGVMQEALMQSGQWKKPCHCDLTIGDMMEEYAKKVTPQKRGKDTEQRRLRRLLGEKTLMSLPLDRAHPPVFASYRDRRLGDGVRACQYDLVLLRHAWNIARVEWGWPLGDNPVSLIRMPKNNPPRERRLRPGEYEKLRYSAQKSRSWYLWPIVDIAIETAMRRGEILGLRWEHIDWKNKRALLPLTKNGRSRWVPLSAKALQHLEDAPRSSELVFPVTDIAVRQAWDRLLRRALIRDLTFHDLRHESLSQKFQSGLNITEVMSISGHRTAGQLFRYLHADLANPQE